MDFAFNIVQISITILLIAAVLLQQRGVGLGRAFGGGSDIYYKKRGMEKFLFIATIILAILFIRTAFIRLII